MIMEEGTQLPTA